MGSYGIYWNEDLDIEVETIYEDGINIDKTIIDSSFHLQLYL